MIERHIPTVDGGVATADVDLPSDDPPFIAVVAHPHPDFGGDRHNPVVTTVAAAARSCGFGTVRFDFRSSDPSGAIADVAACAAFVADEAPRSGLLLAGYSFGAAAVLGVDVPACRGRLVVAPPHGLGPDEWRGAGDPMLIVAGRHDGFCDLDDLTRRADASDDSELVVIESTDHFFAGALAPLADHATRWFAQR